MEGWVCWSQHEDRTAGSGVPGVLGENPASSVSIVATLEAGRQRNLRLPNEKNAIFPKRIERIWGPTQSSIVGYLGGFVLGGKRVEEADR
jgi:hypothetical protein